MLKWIKDLFSQADKTAASIPDHEWQAAEARLPFLSHLSQDERLRLRQIAFDFICSKSWQGAHGLAITLRMQLEIALQACLLILKRDPKEYADWVEIIIYPGDFIIPRKAMDEAGIVYEYEDEVMGEAWDGGPLILSWQDDDRDGINVVIHEFAHKLDMRNGGANGVPTLPNADMHAAWQAAFEPAYQDFCMRVDSGEDTLIDPYAAESPAEFFAVLSEVFFEAPALLEREYPAVHSALAGFYRQNPLA